MAAVRLSGSGLAGEVSLPPSRGLRLSPIRTTVSLPRRLSFKPASKLSISMCLNGSTARTSSFETNTAVQYTDDKGQPADEHVAGDAMDGKLEMDINANKEGAIQQRKGAKIHDFCLGIPFGGFVFGGGVLGFLFSRNPASLSTGVLSGVAILALSVSSLKVWRKGKSSLLFILGQAAIAAALFWKNFQSYSLMKKIFPSGFYALTSAAMLCFYIYVVISGGNPPPKKLVAAPPS